MTMVSLCMKRDGRTLDHQTLETIRLMAVERVREGERAAEVIESYGFNRTTIYKWLKAALGRGGVRFPLFFVFQREWHQAAIFRAC